MCNSKRNLQSFTPFDRKYLILASCKKIKGFRKQGNLLSMSFCTLHKWVNCKNSLPTIFFVAISSSFIFNIYSITFFIVGPSHYTCGWTNSFRHIFCTCTYCEEQIYNFNSPSLQNTKMNKCKFILEGRQTSSSLPPYN